MLDCIATSEGCPFCTVESRTFSEEITSSDAVVMAKLVKEAPPLDVQSGDANGPVAADPERRPGQLPSRRHAPRPGTHCTPAKRFRSSISVRSEKDKSFMITGIGSDTLEWMTPLPLSPTATEYVRKLPTVASAGAERLAFFQDYLENADPLLAQDAYDEFARAPYVMLEQLGHRMQHDKLVQWVKSSEVNPSRRRLYLTMLGVCGDKHDLPMLEEMLKSDYQPKEADRRRNGRLRPRPSRTDLPARAVRNGRVSTSVARSSASTRSSLAT